MPQLGRWVHQCPRRRRLPVGHGQIALGSSASAAGLSTVSLDHLAEAQRIAPLQSDVLESVAKWFGANPMAVARSWLLQHWPNMMRIALA